MSFLYFLSYIQNKNDFLSGKSPTLSFIETKTDPRHWDEKISINKFKHKKNMPESQITQTIYKQLQKTVKNVRIIEKTSQQYPGFKESTLALSYIDKDRHEILYMVYYSTPYNSTGIQYTAKLKKKSDTQQIIRKIKTFISNNTQIA